MTSAATRWLALLGHPVGHSRSPAMMTAAFRALGLDAVYVACDVAPADLGDSVRGLWSLGALGANVTVPHKRAALELCTRIDAAARAIGAVNCLARGAEGFVGFNTDAPAAVAALEDEGVAVRDARVVVFGAGGAARAVTVGAALAGAARVVIVARNAEHAAEVARCASAARGLVGGCETRAVGLAAQDQVRAAMAEATVVVQATTLGMQGDRSDPAELAGLVTLLAEVPRDAAAMDLVYAPRETAWLRAARAHGLRAVDGLGMLAHQGALSLGHWFSVSPGGATLRRLLDADAIGE